MTIIARFIQAGVSTLDINDQMNFSLPAEVLETLPTGCHERSNPLKVGVKVTSRQVSTKILTGRCKWGNLCYS